MCRARLLRRVQHARRKVGLRLRAVRCDLGAAGRPTGPRTMSSPFGRGPRCERSRDRLRPLGVPRSGVLSRRAGPRSTGSRVETGSPSYFVSTTTTIIRFAGGRPAYEINKIRMIDVKLKRHAHAQVRIHKSSTGGWIGYGYERFCLPSRPLRAPDHTGTQVSRAASWPLACHL